MWLAHVSVLMPVYVYACVQKQNAELSGVHGVLLHLTLCQKNQPSAGQRDWTGDVEWATVKQRDRHMGPYLRSKA